MQWHIAGDLVEVGKHVSLDKDRHEDPTVTEKGSPAQLSVRCSNVESGESSIQ